MDMASSHSLKKFIVPNFLTRFINPFHLTSRFVNTNSSSHNSKDPKDDCIAPHDHHSEDIVKVECYKLFPCHVTDAFRTACYFLLDYHPLTPVGLLRSVLNSFDASAPRLGFRGMWKVRQSAEALFISRYISQDGEEDVKIFIVRNSSLWDVKPRNNTLVSAESMNQAIEFRILYYNKHRIYRYMISQPAILVIERKKRNGSEDKEDYGDYTFKIDLPGKVYNTNAIKIETKKELIKVTIPKLQPKWINQLDFQ